MGHEYSEALATLIAKIDDLFTDEVGPVADFLCEEARDYWLEKLAIQSKKPSIASLHIYIGKLARSLEDDHVSRTRFTDRVFDIDSLQYLRGR